MDDPVTHGLIVAAAVAWAVLIRQVFKDHRRNATRDRERADGTWMVAGENDIINEVACPEISKWPGHT